jgi:tRNA pseudouridine32 synthase/23S rRNA pseudouridine746 synthase
MTTKSSDPISGPIHFDDALIVAEKPAGVLSVPGRGADKQDCLSARIRRQFPDALVVHRLDMATSGLMLFARGAETQRRLSWMFRERKIEKRYVAIAAGRLAAAGEIALPIAADWPNRPRQKVDFASGKPSLTRFRLLAHDTAAGNSRIELEPVTGRTHQLRVHLAAAGHPILGDTLYGGETGSRGERLLLHAAVLSLAHPVSGRQLRFESEPPF